MQYKFDTTELGHAKAALLLYAIYKSRDKNSALNGLETWDRFSSFVKGACLKSSNTAEFVEEFCKKAKVNSIQPRFLDSGQPMLLSDGTLVESSNIKNMQLKIIEDDSILELLNKETMYIILLVRDRIQREKMEYTDETDEGIEKWKN